jgi:hypothetical protein
MEHYWWLEGIPFFFAWFIIPGIYAYAKRVSPARQLVYALGNVAVITIAAAAMMGGWFWLIPILGENAGILISVLISLTLLIVGLLMLSSVVLRTRSKDTSPIIRAS